jgi:hypothetical protein
MNRADAYKVKSSTPATGETGPQDDKDPVSKTAEQNKADGSAPATEEPGAQPVLEEVSV